MAERSYMYCPSCERQNGMQQELLRGNPEMHLFRCPSQHVFTYEQLQAAAPTKIPYIPHEKPGVSDVAVQFFVPAEVLSKFREKHPHQQNSTIASILALHLDSDLIIVSGAQARELKQLGIRTGQEMVVAAKQNQTLCAENETYAAQINMFHNMIQAAGAESAIG